MSGVSIDFVGYDIGVSTPVLPAAAGFFTLFDGTGIPFGMGGGDAEPPAAPPAAARRGSRPLIIPAPFTRVVAEAIGLCDIRAEAHAEAICVVVETGAGEAAEQTVTVGAGIAISTGRRRALQDDEDFLT